MNASKILQQLMSQASGSKGSSGGMDVKGVIDGLSRHLGGNSSQGTRQSSGSSGFDVKSLLGGGAMGMLVGSKRGRSMGGKALKYGAIAGVGMLAWKAWQSSQEKKGAATQSSSEGERVEVLSGEYQERRSLELLQAMIMAARADGHIDEQEQALITDQIDALGADQEMHRWVEQQLKAPLDAQALAREADSPQAAREMYLISVAVIDDQNPMERAWLDQLASALNLTPEMAAELERQAQQAG
ncbi:tellurite resistance TerB family protein [Halomonas sp. CnH100-B]|uniref:tellurite resistance TerB family protein n=1 Tax=unclassified Halomonas TaxID=2609666 RepID=UPI002097371B|nr:MULTISPECIES: tellurite resistance TerB family protein [unclassified Halomonas]MCO7229263.1 tellurite resistance TerB family protein [Halomonas sp. CnH100-B]MDK9686785.1 tellurite resistance TerB family protein [Halomonas sp. LC1]